MLDTEFVSTNLDASNNRGLLSCSSGDQRAEIKNVAGPEALGGNLSLPPLASGGSGMLGI